MPDRVDPLVWALRNERLQQGLSYGQLSKLSGLSVSTIKRIESGRTDMRLSQYREIICALGVSDTDITVRAAGFKPASEIDVTPVLRMIPLPQRNILINMIVDMAKTYTKK